MFSNPPSPSKNIYSFVEFSLKSKLSVSYIRPAILHIYILFRKHCATREKQLSLQHSSAQIADIINHSHSAVILETFLLKMKQLLTDRVSPLCISANELSLRGTSNLVRATGGQINRKLL